MIKSILNKNVLLLLLASFQQTLYFSIFCSRQNKKNENESEKLTTKKLSFLNFFLFTANGFLQSKER